MDNSWKRMVGELSAAYTKAEGALSPCTCADDGNGRSEAVWLVWLV